MNYYQVSFRYWGIENCDCEYCEGHERPYRYAGKVLATDETGALEKAKAKIRSVIINCEDEEVTQLSEAEMLRAVGAEPLPGLP